MYLNHFVSRLRFLRTNRGITMEKLGKELGSSVGTISNLENQNRTPSLKMVVAIAEYFDVSVDYLIGRTDNPNSHKQ